MTYVGNCFFFQAEDGIRDDLVTGVQTCALPISRPVHPVETWQPVVSASARGLDFMMKHRSEERRVGKECRSRWESQMLGKNKKMDNGSKRLEESVCFRTQCCECANVDMYGDGHK